MRSVLGFIAPPTVRQQPAASNFRCRTQLVARTNRYPENPARPTLRIRSAKASSRSAYRDACGTADGLAAACLLVQSVPDLTSRNRSSDPSLIRGEGLQATASGYGKS